MYATDSQFQQSIKPYQNDGFNIIYHQLFCDRIDAYNVVNPSVGYPWDTLLSESPNPETLATISADASLETRQKLLAYNRLRAMGVPPTNKVLLGVIIEVGLEGGLDTLAAFSDGTCRFISHGEKLLIWDTATDTSAQLVHQLFVDSVEVVNRIGPWDQERTPFPEEGMVKLSFLVSDGLYFGLGPFSTFQNDAMAGPIILSATRLMTYLIQQDMKK
ncbi:hypothetical protein IC229_23235 [Spirosoma sp. BT702]|uniref:Uncharacterized protein n=1 Tax=Spirosoma profusum TaxID=2771354 RepID=A0A926Y305_9BACT|nr:hypothetical protein [Spirosoma profusum]MBD2703577.1 hypothetical protein [Spirosoma profusum]